MSMRENNPAAPTAGNRHVCHVCGGPTSPREETIIWLGRPDEVRVRRRCVDPWCGGSLQLPEQRVAGDTE